MVHIGEDRSDNPFVRKFSGWDDRQQQQQAWGLHEQLRFIVMFIVWMSTTVARALMVILPPQMLSPGFTSMLDSFNIHSMPLLADDEMPKKTVGATAGGYISSKALSSSSSAGPSSSSKGGAMCRALTQALELLNDTPASSRKYTFVRALAEKLIQDNVTHGAESLKEVNKLALKYSFARTIDLLSRSLEYIKQQQRADALGWTGRVIRGIQGIPMGIANRPLSAVPYIGSYLRYASQSSSPLEIQQQTAAASTAARLAEHEETAEKLAQELLWMADKLDDCSALENAISQWSRAVSLASLSLIANVRVQRSLMKLSVLLCRGMVSGDYEVSTEVTSSLLLLWMPLLCTTITGIEGSIFSGYEKAEAEKMLEQAIFMLPESDQEMVLAVWLREFTQSSSDWPNLQSCFEGWCQVSRKLDHNAKRS